jgi:hypothetical protein
VNYFLPKLLRITLMLSQDGPAIAENQRDHACFKSSLVQNLEPMGLTTATFPKKMSGYIVVFTRFMLGKQFSVVASNSIAGPINITCARRCCAHADFIALLGR